MKIISVINQKGGVAKTTSTVNIAAALAKMGKHVLVMDMDPQSSLSKDMGLYGEERNKICFEKSMYDILINDEEIVNVARSVDFGLKGTIHVVPAAPNLSQAQPIMITNTFTQVPYQNPTEKLKKSFAKVPELEKFIDYVLIDCPTSVSILTSNALEASDGVIIPCVPEADPYDALIDFFETLNVAAKTNEKLEIIGILATIAEPATAIHKKYLDLMKQYEESYNIPLIGIIQKSAQVKKSIDSGIPIVLKEPGNLASIHYYRTAEYLTEYYE